MGGHDALTQARIDLTAALRSACRLGLSEGVCNHFSVAAPGLEDRFLINPQGLHWSEITPADIVMVDLKGNRVEGRHEVEPTAFFIHARLHHTKRKPKVVMHTHMPYATALGCTRGIPFDTIGTMSISAALFALVAKHGPETTAEFVQDLAKSILEEQFTSVRKDN